MDTAIAYDQDVRKQAIQLNLPDVVLITIPPLLLFIFFILPFFVSFCPLLFFIYFPSFLFFVIFLCLLIIHSGHVQFYVLQIFAQRPTENLHTCMTLVHVSCRTRDNQVTETTNAVRMFTLNYI